MVSIERSTLKVELLPVARTRALDLACDLSGAEHERAIFARVESALDEMGASDYVRLELTGALPGGSRVDRDLIAQRFGGALGSLDVTDRTHVHDYERLAREPTVRGHVVSDLLLAMSSGEPIQPYAEDALRYALAAFDGTEIAP